MIDPKLISLVRVADTGSFTKAAAMLSLTQPAVSQHIRLLEADLNIRIFDRSANTLRITHEGELVVKYARRILALYENLQRDLLSEKQQVSSLTIGVTHTAESNAIAETLAYYTQTHEGMSIKMVTDTIGNLFDQLRNYELDMAVVEGKVNDPSLRYLMLDTDSLVLAVSPDHPLAKKSMVTIDQLKREKLILRLPDSNTRNQFVASLEMQNMRIEDFNVILEVNNIATIKDLIRQGFGVSVLAKSVCLDELRKKKINVLPIESLSLTREINLVYSRDFERDDILREIVSCYNRVRGLISP